MDNNDLRINISENESDNPKAPVFKGYATVGGKVYKVALWPAKTGKGYSGKLEPKEEV